MRDHGLLSGLARTRIMLLVLGLIGLALGIVAGMPVGYVWVKAISGGGRIDVHVGYDRLVGGRLAATSLSYWTSDQTPTRAGGNFE